MKKLWVLSLALALGGCAAPIQHQTASGRPEVLIHNTSSDSVKSAIVNRMLSERYRITRDTPYEIAFDKAVENIAAQVLLGSKYDSQPNARISYTLASVGVDVRVIADIAVITNPGSAFERRMDLNNGQESPMVQAILNGIKEEKEIPAPTTPTPSKPKKK